MDKTTTHPNIAAALAQAMDNLCAGRWTILSPTSPAPSMPSPVRVGQEPVYSLHRHPYLELVQAYPEEAILRQSGDSLPLEPGRLVLIQPQTVHAESPLHVSRDYQLLWGVFQGGQVSLFINRYDAASRGYACPERFGTASAYCERIGLLAGPRQIRPVHWQADLQAHLIQLFIELAEKLRQTSAGSFQQHMVEQIRHFVDQHYHQQFSIADLANMVRCTPNHLNTVFRRHVGTPIHKYIMGKRLAMAHRLLSQDNLQVKEVAYRCGFTDPLYFSRRFHKHFGHPPTQQRT